MKFNIKKILLLVFWLATVLGYEFIFRWMTLKGGFSNGLFEVIVFAIPISIFIYMLTTIFGEKFNKVISIIVSFVLLIVFFAQMVYYGVLNSVFTIYALSGTGEALGFGKLIFSIVLSNIYRFILLIIPQIILLGFGKKIFDFSRNKIVVELLCTLTFIISIGFSFIYICTDKKDVYSSYNLYYNTQAPVLSAKKFGLLTTMCIDIKRVLFGFKEKSTEIIVDNDKPNSNPEVQYNTLNIDFENLIANETNPTIISMHKYFESLTGTQKNQYTGMFKGKNIIFFLAESLDPIAIDPILTPTLYSLANNGFNFTNYYSPKYPMSTADGEFRTEWALISSRGSYDTLYSYRNVYSPYIFANSFKDYNINIYHDWYGSYYYRNQYFKALGYNNFKTCDNGIEMYCSLNSHFHASDLYMINATVDDYINSETPFFTYYITVSGHQNYLRYDNELVQKNWEVVKDLPYSDVVKGFIAANVELDKALETLINDLRNAQKLDDTVIIISPDHYPYQLNEEQINEASSVDRYGDIEKTHSDFIIWNNTMQSGTTINKVGSQTDILPTMLNLFGIDYDSRLIVGQDLLSNSEGLVVFSNRSWVTDKGTYDSVTGSSIKNGGGVLSQTYIDNMNTKVANQFTISTQILENNYYKKVFQQEQID